MSEEPQVTETPAAPQKKPRKQRRTRRVHARPARPAPPPPAGSEFAGISSTDCCDACENGICCISGDICVHPFKGGLQSTHQMKPDVVRRFNRAKRVLRNQKIELRDAAGG